MAEINLTQAEADILLKVEKHRADENTYLYPGPSTSLIVPLISIDKRESFILDINRKTINVKRYTYMNRARSVIVLVRLDIEGAPHRNPDGQDISAPHIHLYKEGFHDKWTYQIPANSFTNIDNAWQTLNDFMKFCNITMPPYIERGMFV